MKMQFKTLLWLMIFCFAISSGYVFGRENVYGSGVVTTETRTVGPFTGIELQGVGQVYLTQGSPAAITVITDNNLLPLVKTEVHNGRLGLKFKDDITVKKMTKLEFRITVPQLTEVIIAGAGNFYSKTTFNAHDLIMTVNGSGNIEMELAADGVTENINGAGNIKVSGNATQQNITIRGQGNIDGKAMTSRNTEVKVAGVGDCTVMATETLIVNIAGVGNVYYGGGGKLIRSNVSGVGKIREL